MQYLEIELAWWFNVGVQIFFIVSGFLYGNKTIKNPLEFYKKSFKKILIPYWIFLLIAVIIQRVFVPEIFSWGKIFLAFLCVGRIEGVEHLWFVQKILICYLLLPLLLLLKDEIIKKSKFQIIISVSFIFIMFQFVGFTFNEYLMSPNQITCFAVGIFLSGVLQKTKSLVMPTVLFSILAILLNTVRIYFRYFRGIEDNLLINLFYKYSHGALGIALFLILYRLFKNIKSNFVLRFSDGYSYHIYLVHQIFILGPLSLMGITSSVAMNIFIICVCILVSGFLLKQICRLVEKAIINFKVKIISM